MKKQILTSMASAAVIVGALATPSIASAGWSGNVAMTSDYRFRGITQSAESFAVQGGFDYEHGDSGLYAGVWGSSVDFEVQTVADAEAELDIYGGIAGEFGNGLGWDLGILHYAYPSADSALDYDFTEGYIGLSYDIFSAGIAVSPDYFGGSDDAQYIYAAVDTEFQGFGVGASVGKQYVDDNATWGTPDWVDYKMYVSKEFAGIGVEAAFIGTDLSQTECWGSEWCDDTLVLTISKSL